MNLVVIAQWIVFLIPVIGFGQSAPSPNRTMLASEYIEEDLKRGVSSGLVGSNLSVRVSSISGAWARALHRDITPAKVSTRIPQIHGAHLEHSGILLFYINKEKCYEVSGNKLRERSGAFLRTQLSEYDKKYSRLPGVSAPLYLIIGEEATRDAYIEQMTQFSMQSLQERSITVFISR